MMNAVMESESRSGTARAPTPFRCPSQRRQGESDNSKGRPVAGTPLHCQRTARAPYGFGRVVVRASLARGYLFSTHIRIGDAT